MGCMELAIQIAAITFTIVVIVGAFLIAYDGRS